MSETDKFVSLFSKDDVMQLDVWTDFVCPWCYLAYVSVEKLAESHGVDVAWHSYELRPVGAPPMNEAYRQRIEASMPDLLNIAKTQYGLDLNRGPLGIYSRAAHIGAKFAATQGVGKAYHDAVYKAYWEQGKSIDDVDLLQSIAESVGLDGAAFRAALEDDTYIEQVEMDEEQAMAMQLGGVPALIFEQKYLVSGAQPYEQLVSIVTQIKQREGQAQ
jgi:predicted DsbA family dithiol-disulfide isomerase